MNDQIEFGNPWQIWSDKSNELKKLVSKLINCEPEEIAIQSSVSSALSSLMSSFSYSGRNNIVTSDLEYPTTNFIMAAQQKLGAKLVTLRNKNGVLKPDDFSAVIGDKTLITTALQISSLNGYQMDIAEINKICHERGSLLYVDAYQSLGSINIDVKSLDLDFLSAGTLKWLLGASGVAFLYAKREIAETLSPTDIGWFSQTDPFNFGQETLSYGIGATRFQSGTWAIPSLYASIEGIKTIMEVGVERIEHRIKGLVTYAINELIENGFNLNTPLEEQKRGGIISISLKNSFAVERMLRDKFKIFTSARGDFLRIAPHFYNKKEEIDRFIDVLKKHYDRA
jgi:selenocysteine lyase/cysteine desulfurase